MQFKPAAPTERRAVGNTGEEIACKYLADKGYTIVKRNFKGLHGEIDIIAENGEYLIFAEVKARTLTRATSFYGRPAAAVTKEKQRHIIAAAAEYLRKNPLPPESPLLMRFDVIEIFLQQSSMGRSATSVTHFEGAFRR